MLTPKEKGSGKAVEVFPVEIGNSVQLNGGWLTYTPAAVGDRKTWTVDMPVKGIPSSGVVLLLHVQIDGSNYFQFYWDTDGTVRVQEYTAGAQQIRLISTEKFLPADGHGVFHIAMDTSNATASERVRLYWNNKRITSFSTETYPAQNYETLVNSTNMHGIYAETSGANNFDGVGSRCVFVDGQALEPTEWWEQSDQVTGLVIPKEVVIPEHSFYSANLFASASHSCSGTFRGTRNCTDAFDTAVDYNNTWLSDESGTPHWVKAELATAQIVTKYSLQCSDSYYTNESPRAWTFQGSNDNATWDDLDSQSGVSWNIAAETKEYEIANTTAYKYYRVYFTQNGVGNYTFVSIACVRGFTTETITYGTNGRHYKFDNALNLGEDSAQAKVAQDPLTGPNLFTGGAAYHSSSNGSSQGAGYAFDGNTSTFWQSANTSNNEWCVYYPTSPFQMAAFTFTMRNDVDTPSRGPKDFIIQGSNDSTNGADGTWDDVKTYTGQSWVAGQTRTYTDVGAHQAYKMYRLYITAIGGSRPDYQGALAEWKAYAVLPDASPNDATVNGSPVQTLDTPTNNYATLNPLDWHRNPGGTLANGNLVGTGNTAVDFAGFRGTQKLPESGKWYWEATWDSGTTAPKVGVTNEDNEQNWYSLALLNGQPCIAYEDGFSINGPVYSIGDTIGFAVDMDARTISYYKDGVIGTVYRDTDPIVAPRTYSPIQVGFDVLPCFLGGDNTTFTFSFGATGFTYTPPDGFKALCTANLPDPTVMKSASAAQVITRVGEGKVYETDFTFDSRSAGTSGTTASLITGIYACAATKAVFSESLTEKVYYEVQTPNTTYNGIGVWQTRYYPTINFNDCRSAGTTGGRLYYGGKYYNETSTYTGTGFTLSANSRIGFLYDPATHTVTIRQNNSQVATYALASGQEYGIVCNRSGQADGTFTVYGDASEFSYAIPAGYVAGSSIVGTQVVTPDMEGGPDLALLKKQDGCLSLDAVR